MKRHNLQLQEFRIPVSIRLPFHGLDFVAGSFQRAGRYPVVIPREDTVAMSRDGLCQGFEQAYAGRLSTSHPIPAVAYRTPKLFFDSTSRIILLPSKRVAVVW
jgi:hypothetical protein